MSDFVMSLSRLYKENLLEKETIDRFLKNGKVTEKEYEFILNGKEA